MLGAPLLPTVVGELGHFLDLADARFAHAPTVNDGIMHLATRLSRCACVSASGLDHRGDALHFSAAAALTLGVRYVDAWVRLYGAGLVPAFDERAVAALYGIAAAPTAHPAEEQAAQEKKHEKAVLD